MSIDAQNHLETLFVLDGHRIVSTREPNPSEGPDFALIRRADSYAWALSARVNEEQGKKIKMLALDESPTFDFRQPPKHIEEYMKLVGGEVNFGPAFEFPESSPMSPNIARIDSLEGIGNSFTGWTAEEVPGRSPIIAYIREGVPRSICFCARSSELMAEAGIETALEFRGRGFAGIAAAAWAAEIRASLRTPIYSTSWNNEPSLAVARKLGLIACASYWSLSGKEE